MAWLRYNDSVEAPDPRTFAVLYALACPLALSGAVYKLWRDWQFHRPAWWDLAYLLVCLYLVANLCVGARRAWRKARGKER